MISLGDIYGSWRHILLGINVPVAFALIGCAMEPQVLTVKGPEVVSLRPSLTGAILRAQPGGGIIAISLPDLKERVVRAPRHTDSPEVGTVHGLAGPDRSGRLVLVDNFMLKKQHALEMMTIDGHQPTVLFVRPGDALWDSVISEHIALSDIGGRVAIISQLKMPRCITRPRC